MFFSERPLYDAQEKFISRSKLEARDIAFSRAIVMAVLRHLGEIDTVISGFLRQPLPVRSGPAELILRMACAELLFLEVPPHATVSSAVNMADKDHRARHFKGLINAVCRRVAAEGKAMLQNLDGPQLNMPPWAWQMLVTTYGEAQARAISMAHMTEPPLDLTVLGNVEEWAEKLDAKILPTGSLRRDAGGRIEQLPGFNEGTWWVQDAAAAMPARLLGDVRGKSVIDLCAAPGGKSVQLAALGARVTAVDLDFRRMSRVIENASRLNLKIDSVVADARSWKPDAPADAVLLDAPCSATGTVRRHPEIFWRKDLSDIFAQAELQRDLLESASRMLRPGGTLVYCVCSLASEEGAEIVADFLQRNSNFERVPVLASEVGDHSEFVTPLGDLRTLPSFWPEQGGLDGFYAARLRRNG